MRLLVAPSIVAGQRSHPVPHAQQITQVLVILEFELAT